MPGAKKNFIGLEGFIWWVGIVEDRNDPEQLGRVRVRCFGWHTEKKEKIPTDALPWAHPVVPVNSPNLYTPKEGDMVFGFFIDGDNAQNPAIMGVFPGKPEKKPNYQYGFTDPGKDLGSRPKKPDDSAEAYPKSKYLKEQTTNRLARGKSDGTIIATRKKNVKKSITSAGGVTWSEPNPAFAPKYPYNNALETESGHALEFDDTPGKERIHWAHRNGSYIEIDQDGNRVERVQKDHYTVIMGSDYVYIKGKATVTVDGDFNLKTNKINIEASEINMGASGNINIKGKDVKIEATGGMDLKAASAGNFTSGAKLSLKGATAALGGTSVDIPAAKIGLQSGSVSSASGAGISGGGTSAAGETPEQAAAAGNTTSTTMTTEPTANTPSANSVAAGGTTAAAAANKTTFGKTLAGIASTVSEVASTILTSGDGILRDFANKLPIGELTEKVGFFEGLVNNSKGVVEGLVGDIKSNVLYKIEDVALRAADRNIDFNLDPALRTQIDNLKYNGVNAVTSLVGKHLYPKTETYNGEG